MRIEMKKTKKNVYCCSYTRKKRLRDKVDAKKKEKEIKLNIANQWISYRRDFYVCYRVRIDLECLQFQMIFVKKTYSTVSLRELAESTNWPLMINVLHSSWLEYMLGDKD